MSQRHIRLLSDRLIDALAQILARFEMRHVLAWKRYRITGLGIAPDPRRSEMEGETAESANFDSVAGSKGRTHLLNDGPDRKIDVGLAQVFLLFCQLFYQLGLGHAVAP